MRYLVMYAITVLGFEVLVGQFLGKFMFADTLAGLADRILVNFLEKSFDNLNSFLGNGVEWYDIIKTDVNYEKFQKKKYRNFC